MQVELNKIDLCDFNIPSIAMFHVFDFDDIRNYRYETDDLSLSYITKYDTKKLAVTYGTNPKLSFYQGQQQRQNIQIVNHQLTLNFPRLDKEKRQELRELKGRKLTIIFEDKNGRAWLMGQDFPVRFKSLALQTGSDGGGNDYVLVLESAEKHQLREVVPPSEGCFSGITAEESTRSTTEFLSAASIDYSNIEFIVNNQVQSYLFATPLQPTQWDTNPSIKANDEIAVLNVFNVHANIIDLSLDYDDLSDLLVISVNVSDTAIYGISFNGTAGELVGGEVEVILDFFVTLSPELQNSSTNIELLDGAVVYMEDFGEELTGMPFVTGFSESPSINVTKRYPSRQPVLFEFNVTGIDCEPLQFEYIFDNYPPPCALNTQYQHLKSNREKIKLTYDSLSYAPNTGLQKPKFMNTSVNINGTIYQLYKDPNEWHNDINKFKNDFVSLVLQSGSDLIDVNSVTVTDEGTEFHIEFETTSLIAPYTKNPFFVGSNNSVRVSEIEGFYQERAVRLTTSTGAGALVKHLDGIGNEIEGNYLVDITNNSGFILALTPLLSNQAIEAVAFRYAFDDFPIYDETTQITTQAESENCSYPNALVNLSDCYSGFQSVLTGSYFRATFDASTGVLTCGEKFIFDFGVNQQVIISAAAITPTSNSHYVTRLFNNIKNVTCVHYEFNPIAMTFNFDFIITIGTTINSIYDTENNRFASLTAVQGVFTNTLDGSVNPYISVNWGNLPTVKPSLVGVLKNLTIGDWQESKTIVDYVAMSWNSSTDEMTISRAVPDVTFLNQDLVFDFYTFVNYPQQGVSPIASFTVDSGTASQVFTGLTAALGGNLNNGCFIVFRDIFGDSRVMLFELSSSGSQNYTFISRFPMIWGTVDNYNYIGTSSTTQQPSVAGNQCNFDAGTHQQTSVLATNGVIYGTCYDGGIYGNGYIWKLDESNINGDSLIFFHFQHKNKVGLLASDTGVLYGCTNEGGDNNLGYFYSIDPNNSYQFTQLASLSASSGYSFAKFPASTTQDEVLTNPMFFYNGSIYGCSRLGRSGNGGLIRYDILTNTVNPINPDFAVVHSGVNNFTETLGIVYEYTMGNLYSISGGSASVVSSDPNPNANEVEAQMTIFQGLIIYGYRRDDLPDSKYFLYGFNPVNSNKITIESNGTQQYRSIFTYNNNLYVMAIDKVDIYNSSFVKINSVNITGLIGTAVGVGSVMGNYFYFKAADFGVSPVTTNLWRMNLISNTFQQVPQNFVYL